MTQRACPRCTFPLTPYVHGGANLDHCHRCGGSFMDPGAASATFGPAADPAFWKESFVTKEAAPSRLRCPRCNEPLDAYLIEFQKQALEVDECNKCHGLWLDLHEGHHLAAMMHRAEDHAHRKREGIDRPGVLLYLFQLFTGFPIEVWNPVKRRPIACYSLLIGLTALFLWELGDPGWWIENYAQLLMVPANVVAGETVWTVLTAAFFHANWAHLLGNLYFLWIFGDNVEDVLGLKQFALLYLAAALAGNIAHLIVHASSAGPLLGASGAISGLMGAYLALFPRVKVWVVFLFVRFRLNVYFYFAFWIGLQIVMAAIQEEGVAWFAHLGGFAAGLAWGLLARKPVARRVLAEHRV